MLIVCRVTGKCDLGCPFCGYDRRISRTRCDIDPEKLLRFGALLHDYRRFSGDRVLVCWIGGEPLIWEPLPELAEIFHKKLDISLSVTTNGTTLDSIAVRKHLLENYSELTVSIDGMDSLFNRLRCWPGGFIKLRESILALIQEKASLGRGPRLRVNTILMQDTFPSFEQLCLTLAEWGIEEITFNQIGGIERPEFFSQQKLLPEHAEWIADIIPVLRRRLANSGVHLSGGDDYLRRILASARNECIPIRECQAGERFLFINENGLIAPCSFTDKEYGIHMDQLKTADDLRDLREYFSAKLRRKRPVQCFDCHSTQVFKKYVNPLVQQREQRKVSKILKEMSING
ncbi:radical SAM protein [candidate division KSB1 bacterium]|nr:radical SAM protein [candidate division KSB1 bacterium]